MDQLEVLKKEWQSREQDFPKLSYKDIYPMLLRKSSTVVKWIVIISLIEIVFWTGLSLIMPDSIDEFNNTMGLKNLFLAVNIFNYAVIFTFIYFFYRNYKKIQVTSSVKELMKNIIRTRKTVHYFVYYNIGLSAILMICINIYFYFNTEKLQDILAKTDGYASVPPETFVSSFFIGQFIAGVLLIGFLMVFYYLLYGLLLKRLKSNYKDLEQIEV